MLSNDNLKIKQLKMHDVSWKHCSFKYAELSMLRHECSASIYPNLYEQIYKRLKMLPFPYMNSLDGNIVGKSLKEKLMLDLAQEEEKFSTGIYK